MAVKVLLDTDIGNDIDDAVALAWLLVNPDCDLLGVTTVTGGADRRAMMASALCRAAGRDDIPIYPGIERPLLVEPRQVAVPQADALEGMDCRRDFPAARAVRFLQDTIRANPGQVTLLAIGPMTNVAVLFAADPEIPVLLRSLVLMCGVFANRIPGNPPAEWNALNDPHATAAVYRARPAVFRSIGLDVTRQVTMEAAAVRERFSRHRLLRMVLKFAEVWFRQRERLTFHDPLAAATIFDEGLCGWERGRVEVEQGVGLYAGATAFSPDPAGPCEVAMAVQRDRFFDRYFGPFQA